MSIDRYAEFPHTVESIERREVSRDYKNGAVYDWATLGTFRAFMDTPTTSEQLKYHQMDTQVDLAMYTPYKVSIKRVNRVRYDGNVYEVIAEPSDQGGMHEINRTMLRRLDG